jgi:hypothetical protein
MFISGLVQCQASESGMTSASTAARNDAAVPAAAYPGAMPPASASAQNGDGTMAPGQHGGPVAPHQSEPDCTTQPARPAPTQDGTPPPEPEQPSCPPRSPGTFAGAGSPSGAATDAGATMGRELNPFSGAPAGPMQACPAQEGAEELPTATSLERQLEAVNAELDAARAKIQRLELQLVMAGPVVSAGSQPRTSAANFAAAHTAGGAPASVSEGKGLRGGGGHSGVPRPAAAPSPELATATALVKALQKEVDTLERLVAGYQAENQAATLRIKVAYVLCCAS